MAIYGWVDYFLLVYVRTKPISNGSFDLKW